MILQKVFILCVIVAVVSCTQVSLHQKINIHPEVHSVILEAEDAHSTENIEVSAENVTLGAIKEGEKQGHIIFTVFVAEDGTYPATLVFTHDGAERKSQLAISANGHHITNTELKSVAGAAWNAHVEMLRLRQGLNTVVLQNKDLIAISLDYITIKGAIPQAERGATVPYFELEAEAASTNGQTIGPGRAYKTIASESSGRKAVVLSGQGQYVEFTLTASANAISVRVSVPDTSNGQGNYGILGVSANGAHVLNLTVTSHYSWAYGGYPFSKNPSDGNAHHFYDETRGKFASTLAAGTKVRLTAMSALAYTIDLADFYTVPAPYTMPANFLSIASYGADPTGAKDSSSAIRSAIDAGISQGKGVWIPEGSYSVNYRFSVNKVTVRGAGPWYSILKATQASGVGFYGNGAPTVSEKVGLYDFAIYGDTNHRIDSDIDGGVGGAFDSNSIIQNIWIEHTKVGVWVDGPFSGTHFTGMTIRNTFADGVNFHIGLANVVFEQSVIRNTGDDCMAMWSDSQPEKANVFRFNTVQLPMLANTIGIYGGGGNSATDNLLSDTVFEGACLQASNRFGSVGLSGVTSFARNTLTRCGGPNQDIQSAKNGAVWIWANDAAIGGDITITDCDIIDSSFSAFTFWGLTTIHNITVSSVNIDTAPFAFSVWGTSGNAYASNVVAKNVGKGICSCMDGKFIIQSGAGNSGWSTTQCDSNC